MKSYDEIVSSFFSVDPLADKAPGWTPYRYGFNNPMSFIDPDGRAEQEGLDGWFSSVSITGGKGMNGSISYGSNSSSNKVTYSLINSITGAEVGTFEASLEGETATESDEGENGVFFIQAEGRIVWPIGELGFTTSIQAGIIFDAKFNVAAFISPSLGGSTGGGYFSGVSVGYFPNAINVSEIKGWSENVGAIYAVGRSFAIEGAAAFGDSDFRLGGTLSTPISSGYGGALYAEVSYSFMTNPVNILDMSVQGFADFLNSNLPNSNYSANDALQIVQYMYNTINQ